MQPFERDQRRRGLAARTISGRRRTLALFFAWLAPLSPLQAETEHIESWLDSCVLASSRSRSTYLSTVRAFYEFTTRVGMTPANPVEAIPSPRTSRLLPRPALPDELIAAMASAPPRERAWLCLGAYEGFRTVEMARLRREDLFEDRDPAVIVARGKAGKERTVPLHPEALHALRVHGLPARGAVFRMRDGRPFREETLNAYGNRYLRHAGVGFSMHQLRHFFGSEVYRESGGDLRLTQELLGHADPSSTAIYTAWARSAASDVVRRLELNGRAADTAPPNGRWAEPGQPAQLRGNGGPPRLPNENEAPAEAEARWEEP